jgi:alanyl-tRNA synthetase
MGGQVGDSGVLENANEKIVVTDTKRENNLPVHIVNELPENPSATFMAKINAENRAARAPNHMNAFQVMISRYHYNVSEGLR